MGALALVVAVVIIVVLVTGGGGQTLNGNGFTTQYPSGWGEKTLTKDGETGYFTGSDGTVPNTFGIPAPGKVGLSISNISDASYESAAGLSGSFTTSDPLEVLNEVVGTPEGITNLEVATPAYATTLDGQPAAEATISYVYDGVPNDQTDIAAAYDGSVAIVEVDSEPSLAHQAAVALNSAIAHWRFTQP